MKGIEYGRDGQRVDGSAFTEVRQQLREIAAGRVTCTRCQRRATHIRNGEAFCSQACAETPSWRPSLALRERLVRAGRR
jgi:hypothetical protein